jgi:hypothetical protein
MPQASRMAAKEAIKQNGFAVIEKVYTDTALHTIIAAIEQASGSAKDTFRKGSALFAIRQFLKEVPEAVPALFSTKLTAIIHNIFGKDFFVVKSIYFDKPPNQTGLYRITRISPFPSGQKHRYLAMVPGR